MNRYATSAVQEVLNAYQTLLDELARYQGPRLDDLDRELYAEAVRPIKNLPQLELLIRRIRRESQFRPTAAAVSEMIADILGEESPEELPAHVIASRQVIKAPDRMLPSTGEGPSRQRAREMMAALKAGKLGGYDA